MIIPGFSTRLGWKRGWKSCMANSKDWRSENVNVIEWSCKIVKKVATSPFYISPPFQVYLPFLAKEFSSPLPSDSVFGRSKTSSPPLIRRGGSNYAIFPQRKKFSEKSLIIEDWSEKNLFVWNGPNPLTRCPLNGHTHLNKSTTESFRFV